MAVTTTFTHLFIINIKLALCKPCFHNVQPPKYLQHTICIDCLIYRSIRMPASMCFRHIFVNNKDKISFLKMLFF